MTALGVSGSSGVHGWGCAPGHYIDESKLTHGLYCTGGGFEKYPEKQTWTIRSHNNSNFVMELNVDEYNFLIDNSENKQLYNMISQLKNKKVTDFKKIYTKYQRKEKLKKINESA